MKKGFTLIELLLTITIIGILASIGLYTFPNIQKLSRDTRRKSDLKQYQTLLENYANKNDGSYIVNATALTVTGTIAFCTNLGLTTCIVDPKDAAPYQYKYLSNASGSTYILWDVLEAKSTTTYYIVCSNGKNVESTAGVPTGCP